MNFEEQLKQYTQCFNTFAEAYDYGDAPQILADGIKYSLCSGGKRIRPCLLLAVSDLVGFERKDALNFALGIEMIHTYSLIHDDLPAMDNDDYRRGRLTSHKVFGEGNAVLIGDALNILGVKTALNVAIMRGGDLNCVKAVDYLCDCAGVRGMVAGQAYDLAENKPQTVEYLNKIMLNKTAKMIMASVVMPCLAVGSEYTQSLEEFSRLLGIQFQVVDDILDATSTFEIMGKATDKDASANKLTAVSVYGTDGARELSEALHHRCAEILGNIKNAEFLMNFCDYLFARIK